MANSYTSGQTVSLLATFSSPAGTLFDPSTVTISVIDPSGSAIATPSVIHDSTGNYHADYVANDPGLYQYRVASTGPSSAAEGTFVVKESSFVG